MPVRKYKPSGWVILIGSIMLIISSVIVIGLILMQTKRLNESASQYHLEQSILKVKSDFDVFFNSQLNSLQLLTEWGKNGIFENRQEQNIIAKLQPLIDNYEIFEYISIASEDGFFLVLSKEKDFLVTKQINFLKDSIWNIKQWNTDLNQIGFGTRELLQAHKSALSGIFMVDTEEDSLISSPVRYFFETDNIGVNYSRYYRSINSGKNFRISIGVHLKDIAEWIDTKKIGNEGSVILLDRRGRLFRPQKIETDLHEVQDSLYLAELDSTVETLEYVAISKWKRAFQGEEINFRFRFDKEYWWAGMLPANPNRNSAGLWLGVIIPEKDLLEFIQGKKLFIVVGFLLVLLVSIFSIILIIARSARSYPEPDAMFSKLQDIDNLKKLVSEGESERIEFKSTVRQNLHTGKPGKEIEIAWLKGVAAFLNSEGGVLLIGINDEAELLGLEADNFANDDKCLLHIQNLIKQHIGLEFSPYISIKILTIDTKKLVIISCIPSKVPVFLKKDDKEEFYVRSGPSSVSLPVSKALKYIEDRKKKD